MDLDSYIQQRNKIQHIAEDLQLSGQFNEDIAGQCWTRLGVANRHIQRVFDGILALTPAVEREIDGCLRRTQTWLEQQLPSYGKSRSLPGEPQ